MTPQANGDLFTANTIQYTSTCTRMSTTIRTRFALAHSPCLCAVVSRSHLVLIYITIYTNRLLEANNFESTKTRICIERVNESQILFERFSLVFSLCVSAQMVDMQSLVERESHFNRNIGKLCIEHDFILLFIRRFFCCCIIRQLCVLCTQLRSKTWRKWSSCR